MRNSMITRLVLLVTGSVPTTEELCAANTKTNNISFWISYRKHTQQEVDSREEVSQASCFLGKDFVMELKSRCYFR